MSKTYTPAQKKAYAKKMANARAAAAPQVVYVQAPAPRTRKTTTRKATPKRRATAADRHTDGALGEMIGGGIGAAIGGGPGSLIGGVLGRGAHKMFKMLTGFGDYYVHENSLMTGGMSPPLIVNSVNNGGFIVRHREYIKDVQASTAFTLEAFPLNPGLSQTFPWLSQVAGSFEQYRLRGAVFEFKSLSSDAVLSSATSSALGSVVMSTDYNVLGAVFNNKSEMENYEYSSSSKPSCSFLHPIECKRSLTPVTELYVRTGAVPLGADARLYDLGLFQIATVGMQAASGVAGELWITYEVELLKPRVDEGELQAAHWVMTGASGASPLGTAAVKQANFTFEGNVSTTARQLTYPAGIRAGSRYLVSYNNQGSGAVTITPPTFTTGNLAILNWYNGGTVSVNNSPLTGVSSAAFSQAFVVQITNDSKVGDTFLIWSNTGTVPNGSVNCDLTISEFPFDMA